VGRTAAMSSSRQWILHSAGRNREAAPSRCSGPASNMSLASYRRLLASQALNHQVTSSRGIEPSATAGTATPQVAGHRINALEAPTNLAAERAQTVWGRHESPSPNPRTRRRSRRPHIATADYSCRKRQSRLRTTALSRSQPTSPSTPLDAIASRLQCLVSCLMGGQGGRAALRRDFPRDPIALPEDRQAFA
jgi:hypothetical protein